MSSGGFREKIEISNAELLRMRNESNLNNVDIAEALGVSYSFVINRIGPCPKNIPGYMSLDDWRKKHGLGKYSKEPKSSNRRVHKRKSDSSKDVHPIPKVPSYKPSVFEEKYRLCNNRCISVDYGANMLTISDTNGDAVFLDFKDIPDVIQFLAWLSRERIGDNI